MSEPKKGLGLFVNRKASAGQAAAPAAAAPAAKSKDVKQRWMLVGAGFILLIIVSTTVFQKSPPPRQTGPSQQEINKATSPTISVTPGDAAKKHFAAETAAEMAAIKEQLRQQAEVTAQQKRELEELRKQKATPIPPEGIVPPPGTNTGALPSLTGNAPPPPPVLPSKLPVVPGGQSSGAPGQLPQGLPAMQEVQSNPMVFDAPGAQSSSGAGGASKAQEVAARAKFAKNPNAGMLPAGAFAPVALLNGLDAGTSSTTQTSPMPVLLNITDHATLPGAAKYKLRSCFVLGTGYGDMSAERVYIRFSRLSCVDKSEKLVLTQEVAGYLVDSDGKLGMRGVITDRQGARLAKATLAGFAQGLASALGTAQSNVVSNLTSGQTTSSMTGAGALRAAGLSGAQTAVGQLADFYLKEAQSIFPVISLDAGRTGTIVFTNSVPLNWGTGDGQYVEQVTPNAERR